MSNSPTHKLKIHNVSQLFQFYTHIGFGLKWNEDRQFVDLFIPLAQTSAAHLFRFYSILTILELNMVPGPWVPGPYLHTRNIAFFKLTAPSCLLFFPFLYLIKSPYNYQYHTA